MLIADAWTWFTFYLVVHILAVLAAFGPSFAFPLMAALAQKRPEHRAFFVEATEFIGRRLTIPLAIVVPFAGLGLIYTAKYNLWQSEWLIISIVLYTIAFFFALLVQIPTGRKLLNEIESMPAGPPPGGAGAGGGPPPHIARLVQRSRMGGMFLTLMVVTILVLMVWRPGSCQVTC
jgi:uncharacterized membrane protein